MFSIKNTTPVMFHIGAPSIASLIQTIFPNSIVEECAIDEDMGETIYAVYTGDEVSVDKSKLSGGIVNVTMYFQGNVSAFIQGGEGLFTVPRTFVTHMTGTLN